MMDNRKGFSSVFFAMTTLMICCNPTSAFVNQTTLQPASYKGWSYFFEHPIPGDVPSSNAQFHVQAEEKLSGQQAIKQNAIGPAPGPVPTPVVDPATPPPPPPLPTAQCGKGPVMPARSLINERVGGADSSLATKPWPFLVNLRKSSDPPGVYFCSGSLITDKHVLLAAQCLEKLSNCEISCVTVLLGQTNQYGPSIAITRTISKYLIYSAYNPLNFANDIALIKMNMPVIFSTRVGPVCLPPSDTNPDQYDGIEAAVMGWGPETQGNPSTVLKQGRVVIDSIQSCMAIPSFYAPFVSSLNICILPIQGLPNKFTCMADVGGPVVINTQKTFPLPILPPIWTQVGINSYTKDCTSFGLKTRVSAFRGWIDQTIGPSGYLA